MLKIPLNPPLEKGDSEGRLVHVRLATDETDLILTPGATAGLPSSVCQIWTAGRASPASRGTPNRCTPQTRCQIEKDRIFGNGYTAGLSFGALASLKESADL
jgi:hypothetical protein